MNTISMRQLMSLLFIALFPLAAELVPSLRGAGAALWLAPLLALPVVLLLLRRGFSGEETGARCDLGEALPRLVGKTGGRLLCLLYLLWAIALLAFGVARAALRLRVAEGEPLLFALPVLALAVWMACKSLPAAARAGEIFARMLALAALAVLLMALPHVELGEVLLWRHAELLAVPQAALQILGLGAVGLFSLFFLGNVTRRPADRRVCQQKCLILSLVTAGLVLLLFGCFGASLCERMARPFLQLVAALGVPGAFQRLEALFSALWLLGDLGFFLLLLLAIRRLWVGVLGGKARAWHSSMIAAVAFLLGALLLRQTALLQALCEGALGGLSLGFGVLLLLLFFATKRQRARAAVVSTEKTFEKDENKC